MTHPKAKRVALSALIAPLSLLIVEAAMATPENEAQTTFVWTLEVPADGSTTLCSRALVSTADV